MFDKLKKQASNVAANVATQAQATYDQAKDRVETGVAGKKMVDEGGEPMANKLLAKKASVDVTSLHQQIISQLPKVVADYADAAAKMKQAEAFAAGESPGFSKLAADYDTRSGALKSALGKLPAVPEIATISAVEKDAITIITTKMGVANLGSKATGASSGSTDTTAAPAASATSGDADQASSGGGLMQKVQSSAQAAVATTKERVDTAKTGKKLVDEGGQEMAAKLIAKKASVDTTAFDKKIVTQLTEAMKAYTGTAQQMKSALENAAGESPAFEKLAADYEAAAATIKTVLDVLPKEPEVASVSPQEKDAILYLVANMTVSGAFKSVSTTVQDVQGKVAEKAMSQAVAGATGGAITSVPEGSGKAAVQYAKENPEQAKAAMNFAAQAAKDKGGGKGGYNA